MNPLLSKKKTANIILVQPSYLVTPIALIATLCQISLNNLVLHVILTAVPLVNPNHEMKILEILDTKTRPENSPRIQKEFPALFPAVVKKKLYVYTTYNKG